MRLDEDYLRELELWPMFALKGAVQPAAEVVARPAPAMRAAPAVAETTAKAVTPNRLAPSAAATRPPIVTAKADIPAVPADPERAAKIATLDWAGLAGETAACQACGLCKQRQRAVLGVGAIDAPWLFVGEGPGADEDAQGEPFVGQAGKLLDVMLAAAGLARGREVYIANVVKCRPPGNRTPSIEEAQACAPFLDRQIDLIQPKLIVALGKTAVTRLTDSDASMASLRGRLHHYRGIPVIATYHPAYLLRNLPEKLKAWEDLLLARRTMAELAQPN